MKQNSVKDHGIQHMSAGVVIWILNFGGDAIKDFIFLTIDTVYFKEYLK